MAAHISRINEAVNDRWLQYQSDQWQSQMVLQPAIVGCMSSRKDCKCKHKHKHNIYIYNIIRAVARAIHRRTAIRRIRC